MNPKPASTGVFADGAARLPSSWADAFHKPVFIAFLACSGIGWVSLWLGIPVVGEGLEWAFWLLAALTSLVGLARRLPAQNVLMAALLIGGMSLGISILAQSTGIPFGPRIYTGALGPKVAGVPWSIALIWLVVVVNGRGAAQLILRPWRRVRYYGFCVLGLTCLLAVLFKAGLEPFAVRVNPYGIGETRGDVPIWYSAPWVNLLGCLVTAVGILGFTTPWLINKQPVEQPIDYHPLVVWLVLNSYLAAGNAAQHFWFAAAVSLVGNTIATICVVRGARGLAV